MNKLIHRLFVLMTALLLSTASYAQEKAEMADLMRSNGKIYVVVAVCLTILIGLFLYVFMLDRKMRSDRKRRLIIAICFYYEIKKPQYVI
jgi:tetrahydromethanopterin S-methyltransferase subunit D